MTAVRLDSRFHGNGLLEVVSKCFEAVEKALTAKSWQRRNDRLEVCPTKKYALPVPYTCHTELSAGVLSMKAPCFRRIFALMNSSRQVRERFSKTLPPQSVRCFSPGRHTLKKRHSRMSLAGIYNQHIPYRQNTLFLIANAPSKPKLFSVVFWHIIIS